MNVLLTPKFSLTIWNIFNLTLFSWYFKWRLGLKICRFLQNLVSYFRVFLILEFFLCISEGLSQVPSFDISQSSSRFCWSLTQHYITLCHLLSEWVTDWVSEYVRKLKISVIIYARTLKFGMEHPWAHWLRFRKNQFEGPCGDHVLAIKGPYFGHF